MYSMPVVAEKVISLPGFVGLETFVAQSLNRMVGLISDVSMFLFFFVYGNEPEADVCLLLGL